MTGIEMLRNIAQNCLNGSVNGYTTMVSSVHAAAIDAVADQIEREMPTQEDRDAIAWVREHGGLEKVKAQRRESMPRAAYERKRDGWLDHIAECEAALGKRNERIAELERECAEREETIRGLRALLADVIRGVQAQCEAFGVDVSECDDASDMLHDMNEALSFRLMPEGMEWLVEAWSRFEDGEPVRIGDEIDYKGEGGVVNSIELQDGGYFILHAADGADDWIHPQYFPGERVKRPAPKVLDADGVETRKGDDLYGRESGRGPFKVVEIIEGSAEVKLKSYLDGSAFTTCAATFTHRAPVLAADGKPLREGEHVYHVETGTELVVKRLPKPGEYQAVVVFALPASPASHLTSFDPDYLTHERPDTRAQVIDGIDKETVERIDRLVRDGRWLDD